ncbi:MAG: hypothetical protein HY038_02005 [Nitrospirae bacterium]|nr:hypothetical protein [Nitrospirota bacterium]
MFQKKARAICSSSSFVGWLVLLAIFVGACSSKVVQYPADHERIRRIDRAIESLRDAYQQKNRSGFQSVMLPLDQLEHLQREAEADFDIFHTISLEFKVERIMIEGDDIDVYVHWQGVWKKAADDVGMGQRGHARLQWVGTHSILLRGVQGDLPFGMKTRQTLSEAPPPQAKPQ